jgi:hypothetical protein
MFEPVGQQAHVRHVPPKYEPQRTELSSSRGSGGVIMSSSRDVGGRRDLLPFEQNDAHLCAPEHDAADVLAVRRSYARHHAHEQLLEHSAAIAHVIVPVIARERKYVFGQL